MRRATWILTAATVIVWGVVLVTSMPGCMTAEGQKMLDANARQRDQIEAQTLTLGDEISSVSADLADAAEAGDTAAVLDLSERLAALRERRAFLRAELADNARRAEDIRREHSIDWLGLAVGLVGGGTTAGGFVALLLRRARYGLRMMACSVERTNATAVKADMAALGNSEVERAVRDITGTTEALREIEAAGKHAAKRARNLARKRKG